MESLINFIQVAKLTPVESPSWFWNFRHISNNLLHSLYNSWFILHLNLFIDSQGFKEETPPIPLFFFFPFFF